MMSKAYVSKICNNNKPLSADGAYYRPGPLKESPPERRAFFIDRFFWHAIPDKARISA